MRALAPRRLVSMPPARPWPGGWTPLILAVVWAASGTLRADIQNPPRSHSPGERTLQRGDSPASAVEQTAQVEEGGRVEILLQASGQTGKTINFLIRTPPAHGTILGGPRPISRNSASVTYVSGDDGASSDEFTYAVQAAGGVVSAPQAVTLRIRQGPPTISASPAELDFGAVTAGNVSRAEFTLENHGGSEAVGRVEPPAPWFVEGPAEYRIPRGRSQTFRILFQPQGEQSYAETLHFRFEQGGVHLIGTGLLSAEQAAAARRAATERAADAERIRQIGLASATVAEAPPGRVVPAVSPAAGRAVVPPVIATPAPALAGVSAPVETGSFGPGRGASPGSVDTTSISTNEARVEGVEFRGRTSTSVDLAWKPPIPRPKAYRIELRYLSTDENEKLRVDWRPYAQVTVKAVEKLVTANVYALPRGTRQTIRIVAVDNAGRLAAPSPTLAVETSQPSTWWRPTLLKVLVALLLLCGALAVYRRWEDQQILREIDESRSAQNRMMGSLR